MSHDFMQVLNSQLPFLANRNAELAVPPLFWPVKGINIGRHVELLSGPTVYFLYCGLYFRLRKKTKSISITEKSMLKLVRL